MGTCVADAQQQLQDAAQPMTLLVIDKKRMKISEANLPKVVIDDQRMNNKEKLLELAEKLKDDPAVFTPKEDFFM